VALKIDDAELLARSQASALADVYTAEVGEIQSYNPATRTADVRIISQRMIQNEEGDPVLEELPILPNVQVAFPMGGSGIRIMWKLHKGDTGLVTFTRSSVGAWRENGAVPCDPGDTRTHHPAHAVFHAGAGLLPDATPTPGSDVDGIVLEAPEIRAGANATDFVAKAPTTLDNDNAIKDWLTHHTHPVSGVTAGVSALAPPTINDPAATKLKAE
jgi:hypothetical protein